MKDLDEDKPKGPSNVTNNALFVGSTSELSKDDKGRYSK